LAACIRHSDSKRTDLRFSVKHQSSVIKRYSNSFSNFLLRKPCSRLGRGRSRSDCAIRVFRIRMRDDLGIASVPRLRRGLDLWQGISAVSGGINFAGHSSGPINLRLDCRYLFTWPSAATGCTRSPSSTPSPTLTAITAPGEIPLAISTLSPLSLPRMTLARWIQSCWTRGT
jgi:hypothetical protein